eukprot:6172757-Pleurochrysis_carterae.AAC.2
MRLPSASGRGVLGEGRIKFTHEASPAALPGQCPAHFARDGAPAGWDRAYRILWDELRATLAMQLQLAHIQSNYSLLPHAPLSDLQALLRPFGQGTPMPATDTPIAPVAAACMSSEPSTSTPTPTPSLDSGRVDNLEARMNEQSTLIASLAQGMHEKLQQMRQLRLDTAAAASLQHPTTLPAVSSAHASAPTPAVEPPPTPAPPHSHRDTTHVGESQSGDAYGPWVSGCDGS